MSLRNDSISCSICECPCKSSHQLAGHGVGGKDRHVVCNDCYRDIQTNSLAAEPVQCTESGCTPTKIVIYTFHQRIHMGQPKGFKLCVDCLVREKCRDLEDDGPKSEHKELVIRDICADPAFEKPKPVDAEVVEGNDLGSVLRRMDQSFHIREAALSSEFGRNGLSHYRVVHIANDEQRAASPSVHYMLMDLQCLDNADQPLIRVTWLMCKVDCDMTTVPLEYAHYRVGDELFRDAAAVMGVDQDLTHSTSTRIELIAGADSSSHSTQSVTRYIGPQVYPTWNDMALRVVAFIEAHGRVSIV